MAGQAQRCHTYDFYFLLRKGTCPTRRITSKILFEVTVEITDEAFPHLAGSGRRNSVVVSHMSYVLFLKRHEKM